MSYERTFENFHFGDDPLQLAGELLPRLGERLAVDMSGSPVDKLGKLVGILGPNKVLRENGDMVQQIIPLDEAADIIEHAGILAPLNRSLWTPQMAAPDHLPGILTGAVPNWHDRGAKLAAGSSLLSVHVVPGNRTMNTATDLKSPYVQAFTEIAERDLTEAEYARLFVVPGLQKAGKEVTYKAYPTGNGDEIAKLHLGSEQGRPLLDGFVALRTASAGVQLALQWRKAARQLEPDFDSNPDSPEVFIITDTLKVARTPEELTDTVHFQSPYTALRQTALTGKLLAEAAREA